MEFVTKLASDTCEGFTRVELRKRLTDMTFNTMMRMVAGDVEGKQFKEIISEMIPLFSASNKADFFPLLQLFDFDGLVKKLKSVGKRADAFLQELVEELRDGKSSGNAMLHHLLTLQKSQPEYYSDQIIKGLIQV